LASSILNKKGMSSKLYKIILANKKALRRGLCSGDVCYL
jgi:hypothetical protein